jgi:hypothetical protein
VRRSSVTVVVLLSFFAFTQSGCSERASAPSATGTPIGAAASDAEAQAAADARAAELATKEQELAEREAQLAQQEAQQAQAAAEAAKAKADVAAAKKKASKPASATTSATTTTAKSTPPATPIVVPAGTPLSIELTANVNTKKVHVGDPVQARLASDVVVNGRRAASAGATVTGSVTQVVSGTDKIGGVPTLGLSFASLVAADGSTKTINASYVTQGKSETGKDTAKILGGAAAGAVVGHQVDDDKGTVIGGLLGAGAGAMAAHKTGSDIKLTAGQMLQVSTTNSFEVKP